MLFNKTDCLYHYLFGGGRQKNSQINCGTKCRRKLFHIIQHCRNLFKLISQSQEVSSIGLLVQ